VLTAAGCVSVLRLPLASVMIASLLCAKGGLAITPLVVVSVVVAYIATEALTAYVDSRVSPQAADTVVTESPAPASL
jgi:chloride channel protein, CIC family